MCIRSASRDAYPEGRSQENDVEGEIARTAAVYCREIVERGEIKHHEENNACCCAVPVVRYGAFRYNDLRSDNVG